MNKNETSNADCLQRLVRPRFDNEEQAREWMEKKVDDSCIDNHRFAYLDDATGMAKYQIQKSDGCCGDFDEEVIIGGRLATIGCNYGH